jgi:hypothetical protein
VNRTSHQQVVRQYILFSLLLSQLAPCLAEAKRLPPAPVEPVTYQGVRYVAPNDDGRRAYIQAWDMKTRKRLWEVTVFRNSIDPSLEEDVQHVFIQKLSIGNGKLIAVDEHGGAYSVDLQTRAVKRRATR